MYFSNWFLSSLERKRANFATRRKRNNKFLFATITIFLVAMVSLTFFGSTDTASGVINPRWIISGIIFFICIAIAYFMAFDRMYFYAFLIVGAFNLSEEISENAWFVSESAHAYLLVAVVLIAIGSVYLSRFLKKYPVPAKGVDYDG